MREITLPEAKPAYEWVAGHAVQKVSPNSQHALAQLRFAAALDAWATPRGAGVVGTEWRFHVRPPGDVSRPLVPDVAFLSYDRLQRDVQAATLLPRVAPDVVVEILSPDDKFEYIEEKIGVYLAAGTRVVFLVDPTAETVTIRDGRPPRNVTSGATLAHEALPGFALEVSELFSLP